MARQMTRLRLALGHPLWSSGGESEEERGKPFSHSAQTSLGAKSSPRGLSFEIIFGRPKVKPAPSQS